MCKQKGHFVSDSLTEMNQTIQQYLEMSKNIKGMAQAEILTQTGQGDQELEEVYRWKGVLVRCNVLNLEYIIVSLCT